MKHLLPLLLAALFAVASCNNDKNHFDASGSFETDETIISSEASGVIKELNVVEGQTLQEGQRVGYIDSIQLYLKKKQLVAQITAVLSSKPDISAQTAALKEQLKDAEREQERYRNLRKQGAGTQRQMDDLDYQVEVIRKQIAAQQSTLGTSSESISKQAQPLQVQIEQLNDQLAKCLIINPVNGTVLAKYAEAKEVAAPGKPLYKIADVSTLFLRAYITGDQLSQIRLNQKVKVLVDDGAEKYREHEGIVSWISNKAEFTPKTIQTKEERANLVYAAKIKVANDGSLKIGMYGEVKFQ
jgi:HlyD family secretion protein